VDRGALVVLGTRVSSSAARDLGETADFFQVTVRDLQTTSVAVSGLESSSWNV
jgi:hypothetical protein